jgi:hypothetical protein
MTNGRMGRWSRIRSWKVKDGDSCHTEWLGVQEEMLVKSPESREEGPVGVQVENFDDNLPGAGTHQVYLRTQEGAGRRMGPEVRGVRQSLWPLKPVPERWEEPLRVLGRAMALRSFLLGRAQAP